MGVIIPHALHISHQGRVTGSPSQVRTEIMFYLGTLPSPLGNHLHTMRFRDPGPRENLAPSPPLALGASLELGISLHSCGTWVKCVGSPDSHSFSHRGYSAFPAQP